MKFITDFKQTSTAKIPFCLIGIKEDLKVPENLPPVWAHALKDLFLQQSFQSLFKGKSGDIYPLLTEQSQLLYLVGLGNNKLESTGKLREQTRQFIGNLFSQIKSKNILHFGIWVDSFGSTDCVQIMAESMEMTNYEFNYYKEKSEQYNPQICFVFPTIKKEQENRIKNQMKKSHILSQAVNDARDWGNHPPNILNAPKFAQEIVQKAKKLNNVSIKVWNKQQIIKENLNLILAVNQGSAFEPRVVQLHYSPALKKKNKTTKHIFLVGKGITFDTGGHSLKGAANMVNMKFDMCGAANCVMAFMAAVQLESPYKISCIVGLTDNAISAKAIFPDSVIATRSKKTVEINNTDAEGRLILADLLDVACDQNPDEIIDMATLTGASARFLGNVCGVMGNDQDFIQKFMNVSQTTNESMAYVELFDFYAKELKSNIADIKNSAGQIAGAQKAAFFLKNFLKNKKSTDKEISWLHLDIAGLADNVSNLSYCPHSGASGLMVRSLCEYLLAGEN